MRYRKLRIAFSATCLVACVLLIALWVRSYWWPDYLNRQNPPSFIIESHNGQLTYMSGLPSQVVSGLLIRQTKFDPARSSKPPTWGFGSSRIGLSRTGNSIFLLFLPHWSVVLLTSTLGGIPWLRWRFSLRTLLIATTLVAVVLGLVVWLIRSGQ